MQGSGEFQIRNYFNFGLKDDTYDQTVLENQIYDNIRQKVECYFKGDLERNKNKETLLRKIINNLTSKFIV